MDSRTGMYLWLICATRLLAINPLIQALTNLLLNILRIKLNTLKTITYNKKLNIIHLFGILFFVLFSACSKPSYFGKTYSATENVDLYLDPANVRKVYTIMDISSLNNDFNSIEAMQHKVIELGKAKGADGVIMKLTEEVAMASQNGSGAVNKKTKKDT